MYMPNLPKIHGGARGQRGVKSANERFAGALNTYTIEAMMQDGKALQSGTSHFLGQNFAKAFDVQFVNKENKLEYVGLLPGSFTRLMGSADHDAFRLMTTVWYCLRTWLRYRWSSYPSGQECRNVG